NEIYISWGCFGLMTEESLEDLTLEEKVTSAQEGNEEVLNHLLEMYQPFIAKCVSNVCKRYIDREKDDEFSIGLSAFHNAIKSFCPERGRSCLSFPNLVKSRRYIEHLRNKQKHIAAVSLDETFDAEKMDNPREISAETTAYEEEQHAWYRRQEIIDFQQELAEYKLS